MAKKKPVYSEGDWIVHRQYGVGQIIDVEKKRLNKKEKKFYKVKTRDSTFWLPVEKAVNSRVNPLPSRKMIRQVQAILKKPPKEMSPDVKERKKRIKEVKSEGSLIAVAKLVRDLSARRSEKKLNTTEQRALEKFTRRILEPWSIRMGIDEGEARRKMSGWLTGIDPESIPVMPKNKTESVKFPTSWRNTTMLKR